MASRAQASSEDETEQVNALSALLLTSRTGSAFKPIARWAFQSRANEGHVDRSPVQPTALAAHLGPLLKPLERASRDTFQMSMADDTASSVVEGIPTAIESPIALSSVAVEPSESAADSWAGDLLVLPFWAADNSTSLELSSTQAAVDAKYDGAVSDMIADHDFSGKSGSSVVITLPRTASARRLAIVGLGKADDFQTSVAFGLGTTFATLAKEQKVKHMAAVLPGDSPVNASMQQAIIEAVLLGLSPDTRYKSKPESDENKRPPLERLDILGSISDATVERARAMASGVLLTKGVVASPANYLTPTTMAETAKAISENFPKTMSIRVLEKEECEKMGMGAYLGVSQGAIEPPKFIHLTYKPADGPAAKKIAIIGKGLTFDSGGYNIKAGAGSMIEMMKFDMGGAGATLGAARAVAELAPANVEVHFIIASCENMVSAEAMRPGDILRASNGKTIEVKNTDAEGRLTLADALVYADRLGNVDAIVDIATLTGACIVALGPQYGAVYTDSDELLEKLMTSAAKGGDLLWRMPLAKEYAGDIKSSIADIMNLGKPGGGGSITAALFLKEFVGETSKDVMWAHMDIAGPVWSNEKGGATGYGVRTLTGLVESMSSDASNGS